MEGYKKLKKDIRGLLCREKLENGKKSTVRVLDFFFGIFQRTFSEKKVAFQNVTCHLQVPLRINEKI